MIRTTTLAIVGALGLAAAVSSHGVHAEPAPQVSASPSAAPAAQRAQADHPQKALVDQYCVGCHNQRVKAGGLLLDTMDISRATEHPEVWEKVVRKIRGGLMPPAGRPRPDAARADQFAGWLEDQLDREATTRPNPGRTEAFHRMNRVEYRNSVRDLVGVDVDVDELLPSDDASFGFDNIAGVLKVDQSRLERYVVAARKISRAAVGRTAPPVIAKEFRLSDEARQYDRVEGLPFGTRGGMRVTYNFPQDAEYRFRVDLMCRVPGTCDGSLGFVDVHKLELTLDGEPLQMISLEQALRSPTGEPTALTATVKVTAGPHDIAAAFQKLPAYEEVETLRQRFQKPFHLNGNGVVIAEQAIYQPFVDKITVAGPYSPTGPGDTVSRRLIFSCRPARATEETSCARSILSRLSRRAYRRPVDETDVQGLMKFYKAGYASGGFEGGVELALRRVLASPEFVFRVVKDPARALPNAPYRISDLELASRLSFFLWSSIPDEELLAVAQRGGLSAPATLTAQVTRMLADKKSDALIENFVGQWLQLRNLETSRPFVPMFPDFDDTLRQAFRRETELFFSSVLHENRPAMDLLTARYTFVNERLAVHYGIPHIKGSRFRRVTLPEESPRRGLLGQGSVLTITSHPHRTSPVLRGKWILSNVLGTPPPPPPPNVPPLKERTEGAELSIRERMAEHRSNPVCAACHSMIDPLGFALENFDPVGRFRAIDDKYRPVDASGVLPDGSAFSGLSAFRAYLTSHPDRFVTTLTEKLLVYALGRGLEPYDMPTVRAIVRGASQHDYALQSIILGVVKSKPFLMRRAAAPDGHLAASLP